MAYDTIRRGRRSKRRPFFSFHRKFVLLRTYGPGIAASCKARSRSRRSGQSVACSKFNAAAMAHSILRDRRNPRDTIDTVLGVTLSCRAISDKVRPLRHKALLILSCRLSSMGGVDWRICANSLPICEANIAVESNPSQQAIAHRLTVIREQSGLNQADFAAKLGIPKRTYLSWERMERDVPGALFVALMTVLKIDPAWVIAGPEDYPRRLGDRSAERLLRLQRTLRSFADELGIVLPPEQVETLAESVMSQRPEHEDIVLGAIRDSFYTQLGKKKNAPRKR